MSAFLACYATDKGHDQALLLRKWTTAEALKVRWHRWGGTRTLVQRDVMSAFLACYATDKGHDQALLLRKWTTAEALLSGSGLCRQEPRNDQKDS